MNILWVSNAAFTRTGYGTGTRAVVKRLLKDGHDVQVMAYWGLQGARLEWDGIPHMSPRVDTWGNDFIAETHQRLKAHLTIIHRDNWVTDTALGAEIPLAAWFPIDSYPLPGAIEERIKVTRWNATMSDFGVRQAREAGYSIAKLPHGFDPEVFGVRSRAEKLEARKRVHGGAVPDDAFLVLMVAANKGYPSRKGFPEGFQAVAQLQRKHPDVWLYVHALATNEEGGPELHKLAQVYDVDTSRMRILDPWIHWYGVDAHTLADVYHAADVLLQPTYGEGFGIPVVEAQACGVPVIASNNTSMSELVHYGWLVDTQPLLTAMYTFWEVPKVPDLLRALVSARRDWLRHNDMGEAKTADIRRQFNDDKVYDRYWRPWIANIEQELASENRRD